MQAANLLRSIRKYALIYGAGGVGALQALKLEIFSFPPVVHLYLGYFFSIVTVMCIFLAGSSVIELVGKINIVVKKLKELDDGKKPDDTI
jgi:hypothetical protein